MVKISTKIIAWLAITPNPGNTRPIESYQDFIDETVITRLESVPGVSQVGSFGGRQHEIRITFDPFKAANIGLDLTSFHPGSAAIRMYLPASTRWVGASITLRFSGKYDVSSLGDLVLEWRDGKPIFLRDVARIEMVMVDATNVLHQNGGPSIAIYVIPESGVNVYEVMADLKATVADLAANELANAPAWISSQDADDTVYISASVGMVRNNLLLGISLAIVVLWWFLRKFRATLIVALSIPLCLLMAFMVLDYSGRTLNIISLAGLAFATGMVLDAAIVVLENIFPPARSGTGRATKRRCEALRRSGAHCWRPPPPRSRSSCRSFFWKTKQASFSVISP